MKALFIIGIVGFFLSACDKKEAPAPAPKVTAPVEEQEIGFGRTTARCSRRDHMPILSNEPGRRLSLSGRPNARGHRNNILFLMIPRFRDFFGGILPGARDGGQRLQLGWARESLCLRTARS